MLLLSGVLLLLGFVVLGTTMVQLQGLEGSTERTQRDSLMETAEDLIAGLNQTIRDSIVIGETNVTSFHAALRNAEASLRDNAVRAGVYASVSLAVEEIEDLEEIFWRPSRCIGYNKAESEDGLVLGWVADTFEESIAGAVYDIHITDGRQSFRSKVYIQIVDCADIEITSRHTTMRIFHGTVENATAMHQADGKSATLTEELDEDTMVYVSVHPTVNSTSIKVANWNRQYDLLKLDGSYTNKPSRSSSLPDNNYFYFKLDPPERMGPHDTIPNLTLEVTGYKNLVYSVLHPQNIYLRVFENQTEYEAKNHTIEEVVFLPTLIPQTVEVVLEGLHSADEPWTYDQIVDSVWELRLNGAHYPSQHYYIDHFNMTGSMLMAQGYRLNLTLDWQNIPPQYGDHEIHLRYKLDPATPEEGFHLKVRDLDGVIADGDWMLVHNMTDTMGEPGYCMGWDDGWCSITVDSWDLWGQNETWWIPNKPEFWIVDSIINDNWIPIDQDRLFIDHLYIDSRLSS
jgi:hypothetical protein